jgi:hypothetical protein
VTTALIRKAISTAIENPGQRIKRVCAQEQAAEAR